jgi:hypothetical protein
MEKRNMNNGTLRSASFRVAYRDAIYIVTVLPESPAMVGITRERGTQEPEDVFHSVMLGHWFDAFDFHGVTAEQWPVVSACARAIGAFFTSTVIEGAQSAKKRGIALV